MNGVEQVLSFLEKLQSTVPLELFVFAGSFIEEVVVPIPSPFVLVSAGSLLALPGNYSVLWHIVWLSGLGAMGKTAGSLVLYTIADKAEDLFAGRFGKYVGISPKDIEEIGKKFTGNVKDILLLFIIRVLPIVPSAPVSFACGAIKLNKKVYIFATFVGTFVRNTLYLYIAHRGIESYKEVSKGVEGIESLLQIIFLVFIVGGITWLYFRRKTQTHH